MTLITIIIGLALLIYAFWTDLHGDGLHTPTKAALALGIGIACVLGGIGAAHASPDFEASIGKGVSLGSATLWGFAGHDALNAGTTNKEYGKTYQIEQEWDTKYARARLGYLNEGSLSCGNYSIGESCKRDGVYFMAVAPYQFNPRLESAISIGPYLYNETCEFNSNYAIRYGAAVMGALSVTYKIADQWKLQTRFQHVQFSMDGRATDQFLIGVGYSPLNF